jgi:hypothetical protein
MHVWYFDSVGIVRSTGLDFVDDFASFVLLLNLIVRLAYINHKGCSSPTPNGLWVLTSAVTSTGQLAPMTTPFGDIECDATVDLIVDREARSFMSSISEKVMHLHAIVPKDRVDEIKWHPRVYELLTQHLVRRHLSAFISSSDMVEDWNVADSIDRISEGLLCRKQLRIRNFHEFGDFGANPQLTHLDYMYAFMDALKCRLLFFTATQT